MAADRTQDEQPLQIVIVSGGSGRTGQQLVQSALAQFDSANVEIVLRSRVQTPDAAVRVIESVRDQRAVLCHTLVQPEVRETVVRECQLRNIHAVDLMGPTLMLLDDHLDGRPRNEPGLSYALNKEQFERIDAVDFTLAHDDGARMRDLHLADVVLVGVSRVSKSVTCFYLAARGVRAANVPLVALRSAPPELTRLDPQRVIGLTMSVSRLSAIRQTRLARISHRPVNGYAEKREAAVELRQATDLMGRHGWRQIDVSYKATEEVAGEIIEMLPRSESGGRSLSVPH